MQQFFGSLEPKSKGDWRTLARRFVTIFLVGFPIFFVLFRFVGIRHRQYYSLHSWYEIPSMRKSLVASALCSVALACWYCIKRAADPEDDN